MVGDAIPSVGTAHGDAKVCDSVEMTYLFDHWHGRQSLAWSFWVNLVLLQAGVFWVERLIAPPVLPDKGLVAVATVAFVVVFHVIVYAWQVVGVLRAGDRYLKDSESSIWVPAAHVGVIVSFILTSVSAFGVMQTVFVEERDTNLAEAWERERAARYSLALSNAGTLVRITGIFELGLTRSLDSLLRDNPGVDGIVLDSDGGYIAEGRGVARLIRDRGLDTYVFGVCKSACTTAFIGGRVRTLGEHARLGFHQYRLEDGYPDVLLDPLAEQEKDGRFYQAQGVRADFVNRLFQAPHDDIWYPVLSDLVRSGVVQRILHDGLDDPTDNPGTRPPYDPKDFRSAPVR